MIRRIRREDWPTFKEVRLAALADAPAAFGSTYEAEILRDDSDWEERAELASSGLTRAIFLAFDGHEAVGLVGGYRESEAHASIDLVSMWTVPSARRAGVARRLVAAVVAWAEDTGAATVSLWVTRGNEPAARLYESMGFCATGDFQPLPSDPCKDEVRMELLLAD